MKIQNTASLSFLILFFASFSAWTATFNVPAKDYGSISKAMTVAKKGDTVIVEKGIYRESFPVSPGVTLKSKELFGAIIVGAGARKVVSLTNGCTIQGFEISGGTIGVYSSSAGNAVIQCLIRGNTLTGIMCVGHLPRIEDNVIVFNEGSGIQGWDVRSTIAAVNHNTIAFNGNNGVSLGGNSQIILENNIIAFNEKMGVKVETTVKVTFKRNCFFANTDVIESFPSDNFSFDPLFVAPRKIDFTLSKDSQCGNMGTDNLDIGARLRD